MQEPLALKFARRFPLLRKPLMRWLYRRNHSTLENIISANQNQAYLYQLGGVWFPNESLHTEVSFSNLLKKLKNESLFCYTPGNGDTVIDLGAGLGEETLLYSVLVGEGGRVISVEAQPGPYSVLAETIKLNKLHNVMAFRVGIGERKGKAALVNHDPSYEAAYLSPDNPEGDIEMRTLAGIIDELNLERIDLLKSNIEGAERFLFSSLQPAHFASIRHMAIACHDFRYRKEGNGFFKTKELVKQSLEKNGFTITERNTGTDYLDDWIYATNKF